MIRIAELDDFTAQRILRTIFRARSSGKDEDHTGLRSALMTEFEAVPSHASVSDGDLARQALIVLADDPATAVAIETMAKETALSSHRQTYDGGASIALAVAALFVLRTGMDIERDKQGKWSIKVKVKPGSDSAVKKLIEKLINYLPG